MISMWAPCSSSYPVFSFLHLRARACVLNSVDRSTLVYSPGRKLCSKPLYKVRGMRATSLQSFSSRNVARNVWRNGSLFPRNCLVCSWSMLSKNTATMIMASTFNPNTQERTRTVSQCRILYQYPSVASTQTSTLQNRNSFDAIK